jgi:hypothetical protein
MNPHFPKVSAGETAMGIRKAPLCAIAGPRQCSAEEFSQREKARLPKEGHNPYAMRATKAPLCAIAGPRLRSAEEFSRR